MVKSQGDFHFSFGISTKRSEQPQGDFFARIALQREPCVTLSYFVIWYMVVTLSYVVIWYMVVTLSYFVIWYMVVALSYFVIWYMVVTLSYISYKVPWSGCKGLERKHSKIFWILNFKDHVPIFMAKPLLFIVMALIWYF